MARPHRARAAGGGRGRSAGARVACRTAGPLGAAAVLALAFPLHPPGRPEKSRADELARFTGPLLVVQGGNDTMGKPARFPAGRAPYEIPHADHGFAVPKRAPVTQEAALTALTTAVTAWLAGLGYAAG